MSDEKDVDFRALLDRAFLPDRARFHNDLDEEMRRSSVLCERWVAQGCPISDEWFFQAWCSLHDHDAGKFWKMRNDPTDFCEKYSAALRDVQRAINEVVLKYLRRSRGTAGAIDEIAVANTPFCLLALSTKDRSGMKAFESEPIEDEYPIVGSADRSELEVIEIRRKFGLASQLMALLGVDPEDDVSKDMGQVFSLFNSRVFCGYVFRTRVYFVQTSKGELAEDVPISFTLPAAETIPTDGTIGYKPYDVRVVEDRGLRFLVGTRARPKDPGSSIYRLTSGRLLTDRRGVRHILIATGERIDGKWVWKIAETRKDVELYREVLRRRLMIREFIEVPDDSRPNPHSDPFYRDQMLKIMARLVRPGRCAKGQDRPIHDFVAPSVELQLQSVRLNLMEDVPSGCDHSSYKDRSIGEDMKEAWFKWHLNNGAKP